MFLLGIIKCEDKRNDYLYEMLNKENIIFSNKLSDFFKIKAVLGPLSGFDKYLFFKNTNISLVDFYRQNPMLKYVITGIVSSELITFCHNNDIEIISLLNSDFVVKQNAFLTAEGIVRTISDNLNVSLKDLKIALIGYGNISVELEHILKGYNSKIGVLAFNTIEQKFAFLNELEIINSIEDLKKYDIIINTVPANIIKFDDYSLLKDKSIYDIASYPYGFDLLKAKDFGLDIKVLPGIPGKMIAKSAANLLVIELKKTCIFNEFKL